MKTRFEASSRRAAVLAALILAVPALSRALPAGFEDPAAPAALVSRIRELGSRSSSGGEAVARDMSQDVEGRMVIRAAEAACVRGGDSYGGFRADLEPDYRALLPDESEDGLNLLKGFKYHATVDKSGERTTVTTEGSEVPQDMQETLNTIARSFQGMMSIAMQEWSWYHSVPLLPRTGEKFQLARDGDNRIIGFQRDPFDFRVTVSKNNAIIRLEVASPGARKVCSPTFSTTEGGFLLSSSECTVTVNGSTLSLKTAFDYQTVSGSKLPGKIDIYSSVDGKKPDHLVLVLKNAALLPVR